MDGRRDHQSHTHIRHHASSIGSPSIMYLEEEYRDYSCRLLESLYDAERRERAGEDGGGGDGNFVLPDGADDDDDDVGHLGMEAHITREEAV